MIKDAKGRKWAMRFKQYKDGWSWEARHENSGCGAGQAFATKALAEADAIRFIRGHDAIAAGPGIFRPHKRARRRMQTH